MNMTDIEKGKFYQKISSLANIQHGLYDYRNRFIPKAPTTMEDFDIEHDWLKLKKNKNEKLVKSAVPVPGGRIIMMATDKSLARFARCSAFAVDGTFKVSILGVATF